MSDDLMKHASHVQMWLSDNKETIQADTIGHGVIEDLHKWLSAGLIHLESENKKYFSLIEAHFPISVNRIDWSKVNNHKEIQFCQSGENAVEGHLRQAALENFRGALTKWLNDLGISRYEYVTYVGDDMGIALRMTIDTLLECFPILFVQPQHGYVIPANGEWCLNYTMESELFLGKSSDAIEKGWIDE